MAAHNGKRLIMSTLLVTHGACLDHDPGAYHPESPARLKAVMEGLSEPEFKDVERLQAPRAEDRHLTLCHPAPYVQAVMGTIPPAGRHALDGDTVVTPGSGDALRVYNCTRQKECQQMANAKGGMMMGMGCFGVEPNGAAPAARQAGRTRPAQQQ